MWDFVKISADPEMQEALQAKQPGTAKRPRTHTQSYLMKVKVQLELKAMVDLFTPIVEIIMLKATAMEKAGKAAQELLDVQNNMDGQGSPKQIFTSTPLRH